jgi:hypothetical protein
MFANALPANIKQYELMKSMTLRQLLDLRTNSKEWNGRVLLFLKTHWLPQMKAKLDDMGVEIEAAYNGVLSQTNAMTIRSRDPELINAIRTLQPRLPEALKLIETMLNVMQRVLSLNYFPLGNGTQVSQADLLLWQGKLTAIQTKLRDILRRMPEGEFEMERELSMYEFEHMAGWKKQMTPGQERLILKRIDEVLQAREHNRNARRSTRQTHQEGMATRRANMLSAAKRRYQGKGVTFQQVLDTVGR